jgi:malate/lactate dehydrogenase
MEIVPSGDYADLGSSEAVVVTVGATSAPGQSRLELLEANARHHRRRHA